MAFIDKCMIISALLVATISSYGIEEPTALINMIDTNTLYTASQVETIVEERASAIVENLRRTRLDSGHIYLGTNLVHSEVFPMPWVVIGIGADCHANYGISIGENTVVDEWGGIAIGRGSYVTNVDSMVVGCGSSQVAWNSSHGIGTLTLGVPSADYLYIGNKSLREYQTDILTDNNVYASGSGWELFDSADPSIVLETLYATDSQSVWMSANGGRSGSSWGLTRIANDAGYTYTVTASDSGTTNFTAGVSATNLSFVLASTNYVLRSTGPCVATGKTYATSDDIASLLSVIEALQQRIATLEGIHNIEQEAATVRNTSLSEDEQRETTSFAHLLYDETNNVTDNSTVTNGFLMVQSVAEGDYIAQIAAGSRDSEETSVRRQVAGKLKSAKPFVYDVKTRKCYYKNISNSVPHLVHCANLNLLESSNVKELETILARLGVEEPADSVPFVQILSLESMLFWDENEQCCYYCETTDNFTHLSAVTNINLTAPENVVAMNRFLDSKLRSSKSPIVFASHEDTNNVFTPEISFSSTSDYVFEGARMNNPVVQMEVRRNGKTVYSKQVPKVFYDVSVNGEVLKVSGSYRYNILAELVDTDNLSGNYVVEFTISTSKGDAIVSTELVE